MSHVAYDSTLVALHDARLRALMRVAHAPHRYGANSAGRVLLEHLDVIVAGAGLGQCDCQTQQTSDLRFAHQRSLDDIRAEVVEHRQGLAGLTDELVDRVAPALRRRREARLRADELWERVHSVKARRHEGSWMRSGAAWKLVPGSEGMVPRMTPSVPAASTCAGVMRRRRNAEAAELHARADKAYEVIGPRQPSVAALVRAELAAERRRQADAERDAVVDLGRGGPCWACGVIDSREQAEDGTTSRAWYSHPRGQTCTWCWKSSTRGATTTCSIGRQRSSPTRAWRR